MKKYSDGQEKYIAHFIENSEKNQSVYEHSWNVVQLVCERCSIAYLKELVSLAALYHDAGKYREAFQDYMEECKRGQNLHRKKVDHATAGGRLIGEVNLKPMAREMVQAAIYSHHGIYDCLSPAEGKTLFKDRREKDCEIDLVAARFYESISLDEVQQICRKASEHTEKIKQLIRDFEKSGGSGKIYGDKQFYLGMYERVIQSLLIDGDWTDTACFMKGKAIHVKNRKQFIKDVWVKSIQNLEVKLQKLAQNKKTNRLTIYRQEISDKCKQAGQQDDKLLLLTVPTGSGKTLSGLRFAFEHALKFEKEHIFYIAPYHSILEQNSNEIREVVENEEMFLEHHCNIVNETKEEQEKYERLTESWDVPVIATTSVQLLNTLFSSRKANIRRMHNLCSSVIIFDEIQALPIKCVALFNLAINFLTTFCNTTVILCSATQPILERLPQNRILPGVNMTGKTKEYAAAFQRTKIIDKTMLNTGGLSVKELCDFVMEQRWKEERVLVIVNTKKCARQIYEELKERIDEECHLFHLSTNMCPAHRQDVLDAVKKLEECRSMICVSTQLVEAGVDFSFRCVIRSLAGLDSMIQASGRCNRNGEKDIASVYMIKMSSDAENLSSLRDIRISQDAMKSVLDIYRRNPEKLEGSLDSQSAKEMYYTYYFQKRMSEMEYPINLEGLQTTLVDLLSVNNPGRRSYKRMYSKSTPYMLNQAFRTAGDAFKVIAEDGKIEVVVQYGNDAKKEIDRLGDPYLDLLSQKQCLRKLQRYTVGISEQTKRKLNNAVTYFCNGTVMVLSEGYYSFETGVTEEPVDMPLLDY